MAVPLRLGCSSAFSGGFGAALVGAGTQTVDGIWEDGEEDEVDVVEEEDSDEEDEEDDWDEVVVGSLVVVVVELEEVVVVDDEVESPSVSVVVSVVESVSVVDVGTGGVSSVLLLVGDDVVDNESI